MADDKKLHEFDVEAFAVGTWNGDKYTQDDLNAMVKNFEALGDTVKPPVKLGHNEQQLKEILQDGQPALGWVKSLRCVKDKLIATLTQVPDLVYKAIKAGRYKRVSSEIYWNYKQGGKTFNKVFAGLALLGADIPAVSSLADLEAYLSQSMQDASFDRVAAYAWGMDESGKQITLKQGDHNMDEKEAKIYTDKIAELTAKLATLEPQAEDAKKFKAELDAVKKTISEGRKTSQQETLKAFCEQMVKDGKLPPACRDILLAFDKHGYSEDTGYSLSVDTVISALKTYEKVVLRLDEKGQQKKDDKTEYKDVGDELHQKVTKHMSEKNMKPEQYGEAAKTVLALDQDLAKRYLEPSEE